MAKSSARSAPGALAAPAANASLTIGTLARAADVGVETVRYYQRRHLLAIPHSGGGVRRYPAAMVDRIRFIKRSQNLGLPSMRSVSSCGSSRVAAATPSAKSRAPAWVTSGRRSSRSSGWSACYPSCCANVSIRRWRLHARSLPPSVIRNGAPRP